MEKKDYIKEQVDFYKKRKITELENYELRIKSYDSQIEYFENLSDERFEVILENMKKEELEDKEIEDELREKLKPFGLTLEEFENMSEEESDYFINNTEEFLKNFKK